MLYQFHTNYKLLARVSMNKVKENENQMAEISLASLYAIVVIFQFPEIKIYAHRVDLIIIK